MGAARSWCLRAAAIAAVASTFVGLLLPGCQFPNYNVVEGGGAGALPIGGGGMSGVAGTRDEGGTAPAEGGAGEGGEGGGGGGASGTGGAEPEPCPGDACLPVAPSQWTGPVAYWEGGGDDEPPDCPPGYTEPTDVFRGLIAPAGECKCTCAPDGQACQTNALLTIYTDLNCASECGTVASPFMCTHVVAPECDGSQGSVRAPIPAPSGGTCVPKVTPVALPKWERAARYCKPSNLQVCSTPDQVCAPTPPQPYTERACVTREVMEGQPLPLCPVGYRTGPLQLYKSFVDTRACSDCVCSSLTGGKCAGKLSIYRDAECSAASPPTHTLGPTCTQFDLGPGTPGPKPTAIDVDYDLTPGTCSVTTASKSVGSAAEDGVTTLVCCE